MCGKFFDSDGPQNRRCDPCEKTTHVRVSYYVSQNNEHKYDAIVNDVLRGILGP